MLRSAASDLGQHCLPMSQICLWTDPLDRSICNLRGVRFVLFVASFIQKFLYCFLLSSSSDLGGLQMSPKMRR